MHRQPPRSSSGPSPGARRLIPSAAPLACILAVTLLAAAACESPRGSSSQPAHKSSEQSETSATPEGSGPEDSPTGRSESGGDERRESEGRFHRERQTMVRTQLERRGLEDQAVLEAMRTVPRHRFVPDRLIEYAYLDSPLPIGHGQTISQPYIVASMTTTARIEPSHKVLEIGTGSGYQAAILGELADRVYTIEIVCDLAETARDRLEALGYENIHVRCGDGYAGWPNQAPFDRIIVTAAPDQVPDALVDQLASGGRMVLPVGDTTQELRLLTKDEQGRVDQRTLMPVRFVPMIHGDDAD